MWTLGPPWDPFAHGSLLWSWRLVLIFHYKQAWPADWLYHILLPHLTRDTLQVEGPKLPMDCQHTTTSKLRKLYSASRWRCFVITRLSMSPHHCASCVMQFKRYTGNSYLGHAKVLYRRLQESILPWWQTHTHKTEIVQMMSATWSQLAMKGFGREMLSCLNFSN